MLIIFNFKLKFKFKLLLFGILLSFEFLMISPVKASTFEIDSLCYGLIDNNSVEITGTLLDNDYKGEIIIPSAILINACEYNVVKIGSYAFINYPNLNSVIIPETIKTIGVRGVGGCSSLESIELQNSITSIADKAFIGCSSMTEIHLPNNITSIEDMTFYECSSIKEIEIPNNVTSIGKYA